MKALAIEPGKPFSIHLRDVSEPNPEDGSILCRMLAVGVCGTDVELIRGDYGSPPEDSPYLILGHESLGEVIDAPSDSDFKAGDLVVGIVRRPDPLPCPSCARNEWDMCQNGMYTERGIKQRHGFCSELFRIEPEFCIRLEPHLHEVGVLMEPASIVAKAWEQSLRIAARSVFEPKRVLVTGAGSIGLLAALMGVQKGLEVHVLDRMKEGPKPELVRRLGATYHDSIDSVTQRCEEFDLTLECTGAPLVILSLMKCIAPDGILCLAGVSCGGHKPGVNVGELTCEMVLENEVIFGTVNANRRHFEAAAESLAQADLSWLTDMISRRVPLEHWEEAFQRNDNDVKTIITGLTNHVDTH